MDNMDSCSLEDQKEMDSNKVWQWRITCGKGNSRYQEPFHHSNRIGLDFNVASNTHNKIDAQSVTNGVILEVCNFAKTVNESKGHFIINILKNNFDLGLENEQQVTDFTAQILRKVQDLMRKPPKDKKEVFTLFDTSSKRESNNGLNVASAELDSDSFVGDIDDTDDRGHGDEYTCSKTTSKEDLKTKSPLEETEGALSDDNVDRNELKCSGEMSAETLEEDIFLPKFTCCEKIGLSLDVGSKQSLDIGMLTTGVMLELVHFTKILTASYRLIVLRVLEHNFELDLKSQKGKDAIWFRILHLVKRSMEFKNEPFPLPQQNTSSLKSERANQKHKRGKSKDTETNTLSYNTDVSTTQKAEGDDCQTCPPSEFDLGSYTGNEWDKELEEMEVEEAGSDLDKVTNSEASCLAVLESSFTTNNSSSLAVVKASAESLCDCVMCQPDAQGLCGGEAQTQSPTERDVEQEKMKKEKNMWKMRANRVKQILSSEEFGPFNKTIRFGLTFNVGYGPKEYFSVDSVRDSFLIELAKFALAMNSSQQHFIMNILEYNFDLKLKSELQRNGFGWEMMNRVRHLKECEDSVKFSKEVFKLHGALPSIRMASQGVSCVNAELSSTSRMEESEVTCGIPLHSQTEEHISVKSEDLYPFCKEIGLKLHVDNTQPKEKQDINRLTYGAMTEVANLAESLCGTFEQICVDILKHNVDLDLLSGDADHVKEMVARIPAVLEKKNVIKVSFLKGSTNMKLDSQNSIPEAGHAGSCQASVKNEEEGSSSDIEHQPKLNLKLWQLRKNQIQRILSRPHIEHCPLYSFSRCKKLGIDFNVGSGVQQNLDHKLLTNGIMVELSTFATEMASAPNYFITEILEHNFHLVFNQELNRSAFVQQLYKNMNMKGSNKKCLLIKTFELPDTNCIPEPSHLRTSYCPKCYLVRNSDHRRYKCVSGHIHHHPQHTRIDAPSADRNSTTRKPAKYPSSTFSPMEEMLMDRYPLCREISLKLMVDKHQPKHKLDPHVLTRGVMREVAHYSKHLSGTKNQIINDVLQHNFNVGKLAQQINPALFFPKPKGQQDLPLAWLNEVFKIQRYQLKHESELKETVKKRTLPVETQKKTARATPRRKVSRLSTLTKNELKSGESQKLNLKPKTKYIGDMEQEEIAPENYYTRPLEESDLESDELTDSENSSIQDHLQKPRSSSKLRRL
ncbi:uncharacterized protein LOC119195178 [Pungitius pungitius]|uniref:uncharacterized protein LOC119195178 n=1 Tax=Pungitius pungitius TaxID=134920 RepID=UPI002E1295C3